MTEQDSPISVLHLLLSIGETSAPYNEHCLPLADKQSISICTYFESNTVPPKRCRLFEGDGSLKGFFRALKSALDEREYSVIHAHTPHVGVLFLVAIVFWGRRHISSTVYTVHSSYENYKTRNRLMLIPVIGFFRRVVHCSNSSLESFPSYFRWLARDRICVVQNGVDLSRVDRTFKNISKRTQDGHFTIVTVGRIIKTKNPILLLRAFNEIKNRASRLMFIGDGHLVGQLTSECERLGLSKQVKLAGLVRREEVFEYLAQADLFVSASIVEGLPVAVLETMACHCPVVLSDIPSHREIAQGADFIPLIPPDNLDGYAQEIRRFIQMSSSERAEIGEKCRQHVEDRFGLNKMHRGYEEVYARVVD